MHTASSGGFDQRAETWDNAPRRVRLARDVMNALERQLPVNAGWNVLEAGAGTGLVTIPLSRKVGKITAIDTSREMLKELEKKCLESAITNITTCHSGITEALDSACIHPPFDCVVSSMMLHHLPDTSAAVRAMASLLSPGGYIAIADLNSEDGFFHDDGNTDVHHGFRRSSITALLENSGFSDITTGTAARIGKTNRAGIDKTYTVFLATGHLCKP